MTIFLKKNMYFSVFQKKIPKQNDKILVTNELGDKKTHNIRKKYFYMNKSRYKIYG